ncbi:MAG: hypothetical protein LBO00_05800, partial [Zoogloeaceae bacterium]|nr:hypothetical protein [Zoogloeaceae bacterium]
IKVSFQTVNWSEPGGTTGSYETRPRNVMILTGLTPALASFLDHYFDTVVDARFGAFRQNTYANNTGTDKQPWSKDDSEGMNGTSKLDEDQVIELTAQMKMVR